MLILIDLMCHVCMHSNEDLAVIFDRKWNFNVHIHARFNNVNGFIGIINCRIFNYINVFIFMLLYKIIFITSIRFIA